MMRKLYICIYLSLPTYGFILTKLQQSGGGVMDKHSSTLQIMCYYTSYIVSIFIYEHSYGAAAGRSIKQTI